MYIMCTSYNGNSYITGIKQKLKTIKEKAEKQQAGRMSKAAHGTLLRSKELGERRYPPHTLSLAHAWALDAGQRPRAKQSPAESRSPAQSCRERHALRLPLPILTCAWEGGEHS